MQPPARERTIGAIMPTHLPPLPVLPPGALIALAVACVLLAVLAAAWRSGRDLPYVAADALLTPAERAFFAVLRQAAGGEFVLFAKVRLGDILSIERGVEGKRRFAAFGRISSKHADFVLCDPRTFRVAAVIELDDRSHRLPSRRQRDEFFDAALAKAAVPLLRVPAARSYSADALRDGLAAALRKPAGKR